MQSDCEAKDKLVNKTKTFVAFKFIHNMVANPLNKRNKLQWLLKQKTGTVSFRLSSLSKQKTKTILSKNVQRTIKKIC